MEPTELMSRESEVASSTTEGEHEGWPASEIQEYVQSCIDARDQKQGSAA